MLGHPTPWRVERPTRLLIPLRDCSFLVHFIPDLPKSTTTVLYSPSQTLKRKKHPNQTKLRLLITFFLHRRLSKIIRNFHTMKQRPTNAIPQMRRATTYLSVKFCFYVIFASLLQDVFYYYSTILKGMKLEKTGFVISTPTEGLCSKLPNCLSVNHTIQWHRCCSNAERNRFTMSDHLNAMDMFLGEIEEGCW